MDRTESEYKEKNICFVAKLNSSDTPTPRRVGSPESPHVSARAALLAALNLLTAWLTMMVSIARYRRCEYAYPIGPLRDFSDPTTLHTPP